MFCVGAALFMQNITKQLPDAAAADCSDARGC